MTTPLTLSDMQIVKSEMRRLTDSRKVTLVWSFTRAFTLDHLRKMKDRAGVRIYSSVQWNADRTGGYFDGLRFEIEDGQDDPAVLIAYTGPGKKTLCRAVNIPVELVEEA